MRQRRRPETSTAIAILQRPDTGGMGVSPPRMVHDERTAATNLSDPIGEAVEGLRIDPEDYRRIERYALAHRALNALRGRQLEVVRRHYGFHTGDPVPLTEVADDMDMTYMACQAAHARAMKKMREALGVQRRRLK